MGKNEIIVMDRRQSGPPTSIQGAFELLDGMLSEETKEFYRHQTPDEFSSYEHFGLGLWIRNEWFYNADESTRRALFGDMISLTHPDSASTEFLTKYHQHLKTK